MKLHEKEDLTGPLYRWRVPGGWLYREFGLAQMTFVPDPKLETIFVSEETLKGARSVFSHYYDNTGWALDQSYFDRLVGILRVEGVPTAEEMDTLFATDEETLTQHRPSIEEKYPLLNKIIEEMFD